MTKETIRSICEQRGVRFVNRTHGLATTAPINLDTLVLIISDAIALQVKTAINQSLDKP